MSGPRLDRLAALPLDERLVVQVSLSSTRPEHHDPYRGAGSMEPAAVEGIRLLLTASAFSVRLARATETPANRAHIEELHAFRRALGIPDKTQTRPAAGPSAGLRHRWGRRWMWTLWRRR